MKKEIFIGLSIGLLTLGTGSVVFADFYDFESGTPPVITGGSLEGTSGYTAFGFGNNFQRSDVSSITLSLSGLDAHTSLDLEFDLAIIDSWDGLTTLGGTAPIDYFNVEVDSWAVFQETFDNFVSADQSYSASPAITYGSNIHRSSWPDSAYHITLSGIPHSASTVNIVWYASGSGWQGGNDESFAIDNIALSEESGVPVPEPATILLFGTGLAGLVGVRFRRKKK